MSKEQSPVAQIAKKVHRPYIIADSGQRQSFVTGSQRDKRDGKGRYDLLPMFALEQLALHFEQGAKKYGERNWEKGQPLSRFVDSALRHIAKYMQGSRAENHIIAAAWNALCFVETRELITQGKLPKALDDVDAT
jgi:hypothetical protein